MAEVDATGPIVLLQGLRARLGLVPRTETTVREDEDCAVVKPEVSADEVIHDLEDRIEKATSRRERPHHDDLTGEACDHVETIRRRASDPEDSSD
jgi:hypothetical protein